MGRFVYRTLLVGASCRFVVAAVTVTTLTFSDHAVRSFSCLFMSFHLRAPSLWVWYTEVRSQALRAPSIVQLVSFSTGAIYMAFPYL